MKTRLCPICGSSPIIKEKPLWHSEGGSTRGYEGCYEYIISCAVSNCPMHKEKISCDTIYNDSAFAYKSIVEKQNQQCQDVITLMSSNLIKDTNIDNEGC